MKHQRYVVRVIAIPSWFTKSDYEEDLHSKDFKPINIFFATQNGCTSAGYAFVEFSSQAELENFKIKNVFHNNDIVYSFVCE